MYNVQNVKCDKQTVRKTAAWFLILDVSKQNYMTKKKPSDFNRMDFHLIQTVIHDKNQPLIIADFGATVIEERKSLKF